MTLHLSAALRERLLTHCLAEHPLEAGGFIAGPKVTQEPVRLHPMPNVSDHQARHFAFDDDAWIAENRAMDDAGEDPIVVYHSHTASPPVPSKSDCAHFIDPAVHYVIVSTHDAPGEWHRARSWRHVDGGLVEEPIVVTARCG